MAKAPVPWVPLCPLKDVRDSLGVPLPTPRRCNASRVQRLRDFPQGARACLLRLADDGENIGRVPIRLGLHGAHGILAGLVEPWVTAGHPTGLGGRKRLPGAPEDEAPASLGGVE